MKKMAVVLMTVLLMVSAFSLPAFAEGRYLGWLKVVNCNDWVTLRGSCSTSGVSIAKIPYGEYVEAYYYNAQFCECFYRGQHGYVLSSYLGSGYEDADDGGIAVALDYGSWKAEGFDDFLMTVELENTSSSKTIQAVELYMYAENRWGERIYGDDWFYYETTYKTIAPGTSAYSEYFNVPKRGDIYKAYVGVHKVIFTDGSVREANPIYYNWWTITWD